MTTEEIKKEDGLPTTAEGASEEWDEERLTSAVERLQEMHIQLRRLRDAIPSLVRPVHNPACPSPEQLYVDFRGAAVGACDNVRRFRALVKDPASKEVFARAKNSRDANQHGLEGWLVDQHENWLDDTALRSAGLVKTEEELLGELTAAETKEIKEENEKKVDDVNAILKAFNERHPDVEVKYLESISNVMLQLTPAKLGFTISWNPNTGSNRVYDIVTRGPSKLHASINQSLARRTHKEDLNWTLELAADYMNVKQQRCHACNRLLDDESRFATLKLPRSPHENDGTSGFQWDSYHLDCGPTQET